MTFRGMRLSIGALAVVAVQIAAGQSSLPQTDLDPSLIALGQIRYRMAQSIQAVRNYTCAETVRRVKISAKTRERMDKRGKTRVEPDFSDTVRLEVAVVDGKEIYSWPGAEFQPVPLSKIIGFGVSATGAFSSFAKSLFVTSQGRIRFAGEEEIDGRKALRYDYSVPLFRSGYIVSTEHGTAETPYEGSFWADAENHQLLRLTARVTEPPFEVKLSSVETEIRYRETEIGDETLILAESSVVEMYHLDGSYLRNETTFENCREFGATSELSFEAAPAAPPAEERPRPRTAFEAPPGTELHLALATPIGSAESKVGDVVEATLRRKVVVDGRTLAEKGDVVVGRLRRIHRVGGTGDPYFAVSLELNELRREDGPKTVQLELTRVQAGRDVTLTFFPAPDVRTSRRGEIYGIAGGNAREETTVEQEIDRGMADAESFYVRGSSFRVREGFRMTWRVAKR